MLVLLTRIVHVLSLFVVVQFKYNVKRLELFKIRRYIKCPLLLLLFRKELANSNTTNSELVLLFMLVGFAALCNC
jgi:hypothetical protein